MTGVVVWPYPIRVVAERIPEEDRPGYIALRWVRPNPARRVLAQGVQEEEPPRPSGPVNVMLGWGAEEAGRLEAFVLLWWIEWGTANKGGYDLHCITAGQVLRLAPDRKYPYDPAKEAEDLLATLITGTGAVPVADRLLASLDKEP